MALHGVELQVPLEVLGVETRDGQTVAEASLHRDGGDEGFEEALFPVRLQAAAILRRANGSLVTSALSAMGHSFV